jgi:hypothetical protein
MSLKWSIDYDHRLKLLLYVGWDRESHCDDMRRRQRRETRSATCVNRRSFGELVTLILSNTARVMTYFGPHKLGLSAKGTLFKL